jgi:hypothetical protein
MDFLPNVFVGSSAEGKKIAEEIISKLSSFADCTLWTEAFDIGKSNFENLTGKIAFYDYAILVATGDDVTISRGKQQKSGRDNVLFEFGLFTGGLGPNRTFYVFEKNAKLPSDLLGVTLPLIPKFGASDFNDLLEGCVGKIKDHIKNKEKTFDLGFLPSSVLAYGYFNNFIVKTTERLLEDMVKGKKFSVGGNKKFQIQNLKFTILIPNDLSEDMFSKVKAKRLKAGWEKLNVTRKEIRDYDFAIDISKAAHGELHLVDIPLTLNALNKAIELYSKKEYLGKTVMERILEEREIRNFKRALETLIGGNALTNGVVTVEMVDV